jgi:hypothetical protein
VCETRWSRITDDLVDGADSKWGIIVLHIQVLLTHGLHGLSHVWHLNRPWRGCARYGVVDDLGVELNGEWLATIALITCAIIPVPCYRFIEQNITADDDAPGGGVKGSVGLGALFIADEEYLQAAIIKFLEPGMSYLDMGDAVEGT